MSIPTAIDGARGIGLPTVSAYADSSGFMHVPCIWCRRAHVHGIGASGPRGAHCSKRTSPYYGKQYWLVPRGEWNRQQQRDFKQRLRQL